VTLGVARRGFFTGMRGLRDRSNRQFDIEQQRVLLTTVNVGITEVPSRHRPWDGRLKGQARVVGREDDVPDGNRVSFGDKLRAYNPTRLDLLISLAIGKRNVDRDLKGSRVFAAAHDRALLDGAHLRRS
jgi:hypothetical protein